MALVITPDDFPERFVHWWSAKRDVDYEFATRQGFRKGQAATLAQQVWRAGRVGRASAIEYRARHEASGALHASSPPNGRAGETLYRAAEPTMLDRYVWQRSLKSGRQIEAGQRLQELFAASNWQARVVGAYQPTFGGPAFRGCQSDPRARERLRALLADLTARLAAVVVAVCYEDRSAAEWARSNGMADRDGMVVLRLALDSAADLFGLPPDEKK